MHNLKKEEVWYNAKEVYSMTSITENVIRKYVQKYKTFLPIKKGRKNCNLYNKKAVDLLVTIRSLSLSGYTHQDICNQLNNDDCDKMKASVSSTPEREVAQLNSILQKMSKEIEDLRKENLRLHKAMLAQLESLDSRLRVKGF
jgi:DNA-binding transcriptional MerR regulator